MAAVDNGAAIESDSNCVCRCNVSNNLAAGESNFTPRHAWRSAFYAEQCRTLTPAAAADIIMLSQPSSDAIRRARIRLMAKHANVAMKRLMWSSRIKSACAKRIYAVGIGDGHRADHYATPAIRREINSAC